MWNNFFLKFLIPRWYCKLNHRFESVKNCRWFWCGNWGKYPDINNAPEEILDKAWKRADLEV